MKEEGRSRHALRARRLGTLGLGGLVAAASIAVYLALAGAAGTAVDQANPEAVLDHFKCYFVQEQAPGEPATVSVHDQFDAEGEFRDLTVGPTFVLCNPVAKTHRGRVVRPRHPGAHLKCHEIQGDVEGPHRVHVTNQFGEQTLHTIETAVALCAPATKSANPLVAPPPASRAEEVLSHFVCYEVTGGTDVEARARLRDQFGRERVTVHEPQVLCNPATKVHGEHTFEARHPEAHLVCYRITPPRQIGREVVAADQFGDAEHLFVGRPAALCVPSSKTLLVD